MAEHNPLTPKRLGILILCSGVPRLLGAFYLPNVFGDAYAYTEQIYQMRSALVGGTFSLSTLYGFWLPIYQFVCALVSLVYPTPFYAGKLVSAATGVGVCLLVFYLTWELVSDLSLSLLAFGLVSSNPYHIFYSASAMTDVPQALLVLGCVLCCVRNRWVLASVLTLLACLVRVESWALIFLLPLLQFLRGRKVSIPACVIPLLGPLLWLIISKEATGSVWSYFRVRNEYLELALAASPELAHFSPRRASMDLARLIYGWNPIVAFACFIFLGASIRDWRRAKAIRLTNTEVLLAFLCLNLSILVLAYVTGSQPVMWGRYGLILLVLGVPLVAQLIERAGHRRRSYLRVSILVFALIGCVQVIEVGSFLLRDGPPRAIGRFLMDQRHTDGTLRVYCEDAMIRVLSEIPLEEFIDQYNSPDDVDAFLNSLRDRHVRYLVYEDLPGSKLAGIIREIDAGRGPLRLEQVLPKEGQHRGELIVLYRLEDR